MKRRWLLWLLVFAFVWLVISRFTEIQTLADLLTRGQWQWMLAAVLFQILYYVLYAALYQAGFHTVEVRGRVGELLPVLLSSVFLTVVAPSGGATTVALFSDDASRRGESAARAAVGALLVLAADFIAFTFILVIGLAYLYLQQDLEPYQIVGTAVLMGLIGALVGVVLLGLWRPLELRRLLTWLQKSANALAARWRRGPLLAAGWADHTANEVAEAGLAVVMYPRRLVRTLAVAMCVHWASLASLYALFQAFNHPIKFGPLVAGFSIGTLFLIIAPTPMGIGVVEGVMVLVYNSLGVPTETAAVITIAFRGLSLWLPLAIGFFLLRRVKSFGAEEFSRAEVSSVRAVAVLTGLMGVINLLSALIPSGPTRLAVIARLSPLDLSHGGHLITALTGFVLLLLAVGLWRRRWIAWLLTLITLDVAIITHLLKGLDYEEAIIATTLAIWLWVLNGHFHARADRPSWQRGLVYLAAGLAYGWTYATLGFRMLSDYFLPPLAAAEAPLLALATLSPWHDLAVIPVSGFAQYFLLSIPIVTSVSASVGIATLLLARALRRPPAPAEKERAVAIVSARPVSGFSPLALRSDKQFFFSSRDCLVSYAVRGRVALVLGDPVGADQDVPAAIEEFVAFSDRRRWLPAFHEVDAAFLSTYHDAGLETARIGQEGSIHLPEYVLSDALCQAEIQVANWGYHTQIHWPPLAPDLLRKLAIISDEWLTINRETEKRFSLGWFDEAYVRGAVVITAEAPDGSLVAFASLMPAGGQTDLTLDLVRNRHNVPPNLRAFLITRLIRWAQSEGYAALSLGMTTTIDVEAAAREEKPDPTWHYLAEHLRRVYGFHTSRALKQLYQPRWSPRYLAFPGPSSLPAVVLALIRLDSSSQFSWGQLRDGQTE